MKIGKEKALKGIFTAFKSLIDLGLKNHELNRLESLVPLLKIKSPRDFYSNLVHLKDLGYQKRGNFEKIDPILFFMNMKHSMINMNGRILEQKWADPII